MEIGRELRHQLDQRVVDDLVGAAVPTRKLALLRRSQEKLQIKFETKHKQNNIGIGKPQNKHKIIDGKNLNSRHLARRVLRTETDHPRDDLGADVCGRTGDLGGVHLIQQDRGEHADDDLILGLDLD